MREAANADPARRRRLIARLLDRLKRSAEIANADRAPRPRRVRVWADPERLLKRGVWSVMRLYRQTADDAIVGLLAAPSDDVGQSQTIMGQMAAFLEADPELVRRHPIAERVVRAERGDTVPSLEAIEKHCQEAQVIAPSTAKVLARYGLPLPPRRNVLIAGTDPPARVAIDGQDQAITTPVDVYDDISVGTGRHRISFTVGDQRTDVDVDVPPNQWVCLFRVLRTKGPAPDRR